MLQGDQQGNNRNMMIAVVLSLGIIFLFEMFVATPAREEAQREQAAREQAAATAPLTESEPALAPAADILAQTAMNRVAIDTPSLDGTLNLTGARFDDMNLRRYRQTIEEDSPEVNLLSPRGSEHSLDALFGWEDRDPSFTGVGANEVWTVVAGQTLTPTSPLVLQHVSADGLMVTRTIRVDDNYMVTLLDEVSNAGPTAREVRPFATVRRQNLPADFTPNQIVHQGFTGVFGGESPTLHEVRFQAADRHARDRDRGRVGQDERIETASGTGGWLGITDHYWLAAMIPSQTEAVEVYYDARNQAGGPDEGGYRDYRAAYTGAFRTVAPGETIAYEQRFFAGAKRAEVLRGYQDQFSIPDLDKAVDWGMFWFLTRPFFGLLEWFFGFVHNFGIAILLTTVVVKAILFPLVFTSYKEMAKMRAVAPKIKELQERFANDKQRQMQEMQRLYKTEKLNPAAGCIPILLQIPIFYALYKVLTVTIEMRHAPFFGWLRDLSAPDPTSWVNLFGIIPFNAEIITGIPIIGFLFAVGVLPILYGVSMWLLQALSPPPPDKMQQQIFAVLPIVFTFVFAGFAAGMVLYWTWSNTLSILQQYFIMRSQGVETEFDKWLAKRLGKNAAKPAE
jgi:YidC/Oxa1 family membrane protein insertase